MHHREGTAKDLSTHFPAEKGSRLLTAFLLLLIRSLFSRVNGWNYRGPTPTPSHYCIHFDYLADYVFLKV